MQGESASDKPARRLVLAEPGQYPCPPESTLHYQSRGGSLARETDEQARVSLPPKIVAFSEITVELGSPRFVCNTVCRNGSENAVGFEVESSDKRALPTKSEQNQYLQ
jgi:hypothetical protein